MHKLLIICGPTATGKTSFGLEIAKKFNGEIISADSRQVYTGMNIVTGKDLPETKLKIHPSPEMRRGAGGEVGRTKELRRGGGEFVKIYGGVSSNFIKSQISNIQWRDRKLKYYLINGIRVWLYDVVRPDEPFSVAFWKECADLVIADICRRGKLPIVVGGTGLYIKSLTSDLSQIIVPQNQQLRNKLSGKTAGYLFNYLNRLNPSASANMNQSDRLNPRRLIRAIEISLNKNFPSPKMRRGDGGEVVERAGDEVLIIGLTVPREVLYRRVDTRIQSRLKEGAAAETEKLSFKYGWDLPSMSACGYTAFRSPDPVSAWQHAEHAYVKSQLTWFKKQPDTVWFDIFRPNWSREAQKLITNWYNKSR